MDKWVQDYELNGEKGTRVLLYVEPGDSRPKVKGEHPTTPPRLKVSIPESPTEKAANPLVKNYLAQILGVPKNRVHILSGEDSRQKDLWISGINANSRFILLMEAQEFPNTNEIARHRSPLKH